MKLLITIVSVGILIVGCEKASVNKYELVLNQPISMKQGQVYQNHDYHLTLMMDSVLNDSRCPINALCIWIGNAEVRFAFTHNQDSISFSLNTLLPPKDTLVFGYRIELLNLTFPEAFKPIKQDEYVAQVKVTVK